MLTFFYWKDVYYWETYLAHFSPFSQLQESKWKSSCWSKNFSQLIRRRGKYESSSRHKFSFHLRVNVVLESSCHRNIKQSNEMNSYFKNDNDPEVIIGRIIDGERCCCCIGHLINHGCIRWKNIIDTACFVFVTKFWSETKDQCICNHTSIVEET